VVEFCPKCGSILVPSRKNNETYLVCNRCGFSKLAKDVSSYKRREKISDERKVKVLVLERTEKRGKEKLEEERELLQEYYEIFLDTMEEESGEE